ncbi:AAA family ATPase [Plantactinospora sp. B5E13]|uniref:ATP-binding protein n=1 Tax=Plantactinospora sp. B5E13 TaxID=3153758 RepID=UPI00325DF3DC
MFVGREAELTRLVEAADEVVRRREPALVLISGDAGAGKTALAEALTATLATDGWATAWGRIPEYDGAPPGWPWRQITDALPPGAPTAPAVHPTGPGPEPERQPAAEPERQPGPDPGLVADPAVARFRLRRAVVGRLSTVAGHQPALLVVDDLHRADPDTLDLLTALLAEPEPVTGPVLLVGTYRATEITPELTVALARLARTEPLRIYLGGLAEPATGALAGAVIGRGLDPATVRLVQWRSGGNPFFVRELARLLAAEGAAALETVPAGVRDVIRHRLGRLSEPARTVLRWAAVLGRDVDPELLAALAAGAGAEELTEALLLDALDEAVRAGFLTGEEADGRLRFSHVLVRDTLYADLSTPRRARWHTVVAETLEQLRPDDVAALAHHYGRATGRAAAVRAAYHAGAAAARAERRTRPHEAARLWRDAVAAYDRSGQGAAPGRLAATMGLGRTLAVTGRLTEARRHRAEAIALAERLDDAALTAEVLAAFEVPASWTRNDDERLSARIVRLAERALGTLPDGYVAQRSRLLSTLALELRGTTGDRGRRAAYQAEESARRAGDPELLAFALNARFMHSFARTGLAADRAAIGAELVEVAARHGLVTFEVLGHLVGVQAYAALADFGPADAHAAAADRLAARYDLPLVGVLTRWYGGLRLAVAGRVGEAEATYRAVAAAQATSGMPGMSRGLLPLALLSLRLSGHDLPQDRPPTLPEDADWGPEEPWVRPLLLLAAGRRTEAADALRSLPESPHDLLREARLVLALRTALTLDDHVVLRRVHTELLPAVDELAGAGSGVFSFGPVAGYLAGSAAALGRPEEAAEHRRTAATVAARAGGSNQRRSAQADSGDQRR